AGLVQVEPVGVRDAPGGHQQQLGAGAGAVGEVQLDAIGMFDGGAHLGIGVQLPAGGGLAGERGGDVGVLGPEQRGPAGDDRDVDAERGEDVGEFGGNETAAEDDHRLREVLDAHHRVGGVERNAGGCDRLGNDRAGAGGDDDLVCFEFLGAGGGGGGGGGDGELARAVEPSRAQMGAGIRAATAAVLQAAGRDRVDAAEDAVADVAPAHGFQTGVDAEPGGFADAGGHLGGIDEH